MPQTELETLRDDAEAARTLTRDPATCQHTEAYWNAEDDCFACGADPAPEEEPAPSESP